MEKNLEKIYIYREFPGGPVVRTPSFRSTAGGMGSIPGQGTKIYMCVSVCVCVCVCVYNWITLLYTWN